MTAEPIDRDATKNERGEWPQMEGMEEAPACACLVGFLEEAELQGLIRHLSFFNSYHLWSIKHVPGTVLYILQKQAHSRTP